MRSRIGLLVALMIVRMALAMPPAPQPGAPPQRLHDTGLYRPDSLEPRAGVHPFSPQYPLWSDGTTKRRWIWLPPGAAIDASQPDAWEFPRGTKLWKEFSLGRRIETRLIERLADGSWRYASYVWNGAGTEALLAPQSGTRVAGAGGAADYAVPSAADCRACHEGAPVPVLGFSALQLSPDRDPLAPHADAVAADDLDLRSLAALGLLRNLPPALLASPPRIAAGHPLERAALGYLHGNCGHCHSADTDAGVPVDLVLRQRAAGEPPRTVAQPLLSLLLRRMSSRDPRVQMPPLGTRIPDAGGLALIGRWIDGQPTTHEGDTR